MTSCKYVIVIRFKLYVIFVLQVQRGVELPTETRDEETLSW